LMLGPTSGSKSIILIKREVPGGLGRAISGMVLRQGTLSLLRSWTHLELRTSPLIDHWGSIPSRSAQGLGQTFSFCHYSVNSSYSDWDHFKLRDVSQQVRLGLRVTGSPHHWVSWVASF
jgi:hypothetical protein